MTWSISKSGPRAEVEEYLEDLPTPENLGDTEANDFEGAVTYLLLQVANAPYDVGVSASGHRSADPPSCSISMSVSEWKPASQVAKAA